MTFFFYITEPLTSLPSLLLELENDGALTNFKVNLQKSEALNVSLPDYTLTGLLTKSNTKNHCKSKLHI